MSEAAARQAIIGLIAEADGAFAAGDADRYADLFTDDGAFLLLHREPALGPDAIRARLADGFARFDTSDWSPSVELVETSGDLGHAFTTYTEHLVERGTGARTLVRGRLAWFLRRGPDGRWRIRLLMNSHSQPMETAVTLDEGGAGADGTPQGVLGAFNRALAVDDADAMAGLFTADAQLLFANRPPAVGRPAIRAHWAPIFAANLTTDPELTCSVVDVHGDDAYAACTYAETVEPRSGGPARRLHGRATFILRREADGAWRIRMAMNSPAPAPPEDAP